MPNDVNHTVFLIVLFKTNGFLAFFLRNLVIFTCLPIFEVVFVPLSNFHIKITQ